MTIIDETSCKVIKTKFKKKILPFIIKSSVRLESSDLNKKSLMKAQNTNNFFFFS